MRPVPTTVDAALSARPVMSGPKVEYVETVVHPAFETDVQNRGEFVLLAEDMLLRRQLLPVGEEMEISATSILVRRDGKETTRPIPGRMRPYFSVLLAAVSQKSAPQLDDLVGELNANDGRWTLHLATKAGKKGSLALTGCGDVLQSVTLFLKRGQQRHIRFVTP